MIAVKREVAAARQVFRGANVKRPERCPAAKPDDKSLYKQ